MCGVAGVFSYRDSAPLVDRGELLAIRDHMANRGPDGAGVWLDKRQRIGLAHRRLAIIDLGDGGAQPMVTADGRLHVVFNGEIYNYRELRERLANRGHLFRTGSDTEVLLHAYREYGRDMLEHLCGMFAFALWDEDAQGLFLARDPFGIKPLYYHDDGYSFRLASQVKALLAGGLQTRREPAGLVGFFLWGNVPEPYTLHRGVLALPAGHSMWVDRDGVHAPHRYFDVVEELSRAATSKPEESAREVLAMALRDSVQSHLLADVPVGVFLSSGLDSATLAALASERGKRIEAITLGFDEYQGSPADEVPLARLVARHYGCHHHVESVSRRDFEDEFPALIQAMDQPSIDGANTYFVARVAKRAGLKAALSGVGGDELLGGYPSFRQIPALVDRFGPLAKIPSLGRAMRYVSAPLLRHLVSPKYAGLFEFGGSYGGAYLLRRGLFMPWELPDLLDPDLVKEGWATLRLVARLDEWVEPLGNSHAKVAALEMATYMRNMLLRDADWAGMAHSLEIRTPLVDVALFRNLTRHLVNPNGLPGKAMLGTVPLLPLPDEILRRPKTGFAMPIGRWLKEMGEQGSLRGWSRVVLAGFDNEDK